LETQKVKSKRGEIRQRRNNREVGGKKESEAGGGDRQFRNTEGNDLWGEEDTWRRRDILTGRSNVRNGGVTLGRRNGDEKIHLVSMEIK